MKATKYTFERRSGMIIAGVDEVGRGPLAGPVVAAAVIFTLNSQLIEGLKDSKKLSPQKREKLFTIIKSSCSSYAFGRCEAAEIDEINILQATLLAMKRAIENLPIIPDLVLVDGNQPPAVKIPVETIINGDATEPVISAASILAKVIRDREMEIYDYFYPQYGFANHKGYGTKEHLEALAKHGPSPIHRHSFAPLNKISGGQHANR
jgi:ribonuclease HII